MPKYHIVVAFFPSISCKTNSKDQKIKKVYKNYHGEMINILFLAIYTKFGHDLVLTANCTFKQLTTALTARYETFSLNEA